MKIKYLLCIIVLLIIFWYSYVNVKVVENDEKKYINSHDVILASWYLKQPDAQWKEPTHVIPSKTYAYMKNFYETAKILNLHVIIFHDSLSISFVRMYETQRIIFIRTDGPPDYISPQDWRFFQYKQFLRRREFKHIIFADISDTFFFHDPFYYMKNHNRNLFITRDVGTLQNNLWMRTKFKYCYNMTELKNLPVYNDGVWGGKAPVVYEFLNCFVKILRKKKPYENCNMMAMNICAHQPRFQMHMDDPTLISNPYLKQCDNTYYPIIHNKCIKLDPTGNWNNKCILEIHSQIELRDCL